MEERRVCFRHLRSFFALSFHPPPPCPQDRLLLLLSHLSLPLYPFFNKHFRFSSAQFPPPQLPHTHTHTTLSRSSRNRQAIRIRTVHVCTSDRRYLSIAFPSSPPFDPSLCRQTHLPKPPDGSVNSFCVERGERGIHKYHQAREPVFALQYSCLQPFLRHSGLSIQ